MSVCKPSDSRDSYSCVPISYHLCKCCGLHFCRYMFLGDHYASTYNFNIYIPQIFHRHFLRHLKLTSPDTSLLPPQIFHSTASPAIPFHNSESNMSARMLYRVLLSYLLYLSVYASSETKFPSLEEALVGVVSWFFFSLSLLGVLADLLPSS